MALDDHAINGRCQGRVPLHLARAAKGGFGLCQVCPGEIALSRRRSARGLSGVEPLPGDCAAIEQVLRAVALEHRVCQRRLRGLHPRMSDVDGRFGGVNLRVDFPAVEHGDNLSRRGRDRRCRHGRSTACPAASPPRPHVFAARGSRKSGVSIRDPRPRPSWRRRRRGIRQWCPQRRRQARRRGMRRRGERSTPARVPRRSSERSEQIITHCHGPLSLRVLLSYETGRRMPRISSGSSCRSPRAWFQEGRARARPDPRQARGAVPDQSSRCRASLPTGRASAAAGFNPAANSPRSMHVVMSASARAVVS